MTCTLSIKGYRLNWVVIVAVVGLALLLGLVNNARVYEEQQVQWTAPVEMEGAE